MADIEQALRRDLADAVKSKMSDLILNGDESTNAHEPDGFYTKIAAPTAPTAEAGLRRLCRRARDGGGRNPCKHGDRSIERDRHRELRSRGIGLSNRERRKRLAGAHENAE